MLAPARRRRSACCSRRPSRRSSRSTRRRSTSRRGGSRTSTGWSATSCGSRSARCSSRSSWPTASDDRAARAGYRDVIDRNLTRLVRLTDQLAMMSRLKTSTDTRRPSSCRSALVAREVARQLRDMAERRERRDPDRRRPAGHRGRRRRRRVDPREPGLERDQVLGSRRSRSGSSRCCGEARPDGLRRSSCATTAWASRPSTCRGSSSGRTARTRIATRSWAPTASAWAWRSCSDCVTDQGGQVTRRVASRRRRDVHASALPRASERSLASASSRPRL